MIDDARSLGDGQQLDCDVCIVGAGAAGLSIAQELMGRGLRVLVLESGGLEREAPTQALYRGENAGRAYFPLEACRSRVFGGSTRCWTGLCAPLEPIDFERRDWVPHSGWPFSREHLEPYYRRAHPLLGLGPFDYAPRVHPGGAAPFGSRGPLETGLLRISRLDAGRDWRPRFRTARDVRVLLHANATRLALHPDGRRLERIDVRCLDGPQLRVYARAHVLATGGIENARLLLASNDVQRRGVGNERDLVGRFFMEHPHLDGEGVVVESARMPDHAFYRIHPTGRGLAWGRFVPSAALLREERILGFSLFLLPPGERADPPLARAVAAVAADSDAPAAERRRAPPRVFRLGTPSEQAPNPESRVTLASERDALGLPRARLAWRLSPLDRRSVRRAHELFALTLGRAGLGRLKLTLPDDDRWPPQLEGGNHHMGTTRMADHPEAGVVDGQGRVHGVENLWVAGSSVFPTSGAANPTLTIVALALRLADHLAEQLS